MAYVTNEDGDVKVRDAKGISKFIPKHLAEDKQLMNTMHFEIVEAPIPFCEEFKVGQMDSERLEVVENPTPVVEVAPTKSNDKKKK